VIASFGNRLAEDLWDDKTSRAVRQFSPELRRAARRKLFYLNDAEQLKDLRAPPGNRLEALKGDWRGYRSIRINDPWRVVFRWENGQASDIRVLDYH
jgi:proteic killer suppression protein